MKTLLITLAFSGSLAGAQATQPKIQLCPTGSAQLVAGKDGALFFRALLNGLPGFPIYYNSAELLKRFNSELHKAGVRLVIAQLPSQLISSASLFDFNDADTKMFAPSLYETQYATALQFIRTAGIPSPDIQAYLHPDLFRSS